MADAVNMTNMCLALHCLPRSGGLFDQDPDDVRKMQFVMIAQSERDKLDQDKQKAEMEAKRRGARH